jgi:hypothetical protein
VKVHKTNDDHGGEMVDKVCVWHELDLNFTSRHLLDDVRYPQALLRETSRGLCGEKQTNQKNRNDFASIHNKKQSSLEVSCISLFSLSNGQKSV